MVVSTSLLATLKEHEVLRLQFLLGLQHMCRAWYLKGPESHRRGGSSFWLPCLPSSSAVSRVFLLSRKEKYGFVFETILTVPFTVFALSSSSSETFLDSDSCKDGSLIRPQTVLGTSLHQFFNIDWSN